MNRCRRGPLPVVITQSHVSSRREASRETMRSVPGNDYDCDDNECRNQRKSAIKCFRSGLCGSVGRRHGLCWRMQLANEPANSLGFHWIGRYDDSFDVTAFGAVERAKFVSGRPRRDARKHHARLAFRAAESLNCEQRDCGWVKGHFIPPSGQAGAQNSQSPVDAEEGR